MSRKHETNRRNARASTGPKSRAGKARASANARRHGLNIPIWLDAELAADAETLARHLAAESVRPTRNTLAHARRIAEAQIDLNRVRAKRREILAAGWSAAGYWGVERYRLPTGRQLDIMHGLGGARKVGLVMRDQTRRLQRLERYERRLLSKRKRAIQDFDVVCILDGLGVDDAAPADPQG
jgi:hypothetical protein